MNSTAGLGCLVFIIFTFTCLVFMIGFGGVGFFLVMPLLQWFIPTFIVFFILAIRYDTKRTEKAKREEVKNKK